MVLDTELHLKSDRKEICIYTSRRVLLYSIAKGNPKRREYMHLKIENHMYVVEQIYNRFKLSQKLR